MTAPARLAALTALMAVAVLLAPAATAATQDPATYPAGIVAVANSPVEDGADFDITVELDTAAETVSVYVCKFPSAEAEAPEICYMPLGAHRTGTTWTASTAAVEHPDWRDGWALGYKVMARASGGELHAPDRTIASGEYDYYRVVVGEPDAAPVGTAVVEDAPIPETPESTDEQASRDAPAGSWTLAALAGLAVLLRPRRL